MKIKNLINKINKIKKTLVKNNKYIYFPIDFNIINSYWLNTKEIGLLLVWPYNLKISYSKDIIQKINDIINDFFNTTKNISTEINEIDLLKNFSWNKKNNKIIYVTTGNDEADIKKFIEIKHNFLFDDPKLLYKEFLLLVYILSLNEKELNEFLKQEMNNLDKNIDNHIKERLIMNKYNNILNKFIFML